MRSHVLSGTKYFHSFEKGPIKPTTSARPAATLSFISQRQQQRLLSCRPHNLTLLQSTPKSREADNGTLIAFLLGETLWRWIMVTKPLAVSLVPQLFPLRITT